MSLRLRLLLMTFLGALYHGPDAADRPVELSGPASLLQLLRLVSTLGDLGRPQLPIRFGFSMIGSLYLSGTISEGCCTGILPFRLSTFALGVRLGRMLSKKLGRRCLSFCFLESGSINRAIPGEARMLPRSDSLSLRDPTVAANEADSTSLARTRKRIIAAFEVGG
jgi:hypothetical protein